MKLQLLTLNEILGSLGLSFKVQMNQVTVVFCNSVDCMY